MFIIRLCSLDIIIIDISILFMAPIYRRHYNINILVTGPKHYACCGLFMGLYNSVLGSWSRRFWPGAHNTIFHLFEPGIHLWLASTTEAGLKYIYEPHPLLDEHHPLLDGRHGKIDTIIQKTRVYNGYNHVANNKHLNNPIVVLTLQGHIMAKVLITDSSLKICFY